MFWVVRIGYFFFQWFREIGWKDQDAVLRFPTSLEKPQRKQVHEIAQSFGLGTSSSGFGETVWTFYILNSYKIVHTKCSNVWNQYSLEIMLLICIENHSVSMNSREKMHYIWSMVVKKLISIVQQTWECLLVFYFSWKPNSFLSWQNVL